MNPQKGLELLEFIDTYLVDNYHIDDPEELALKWVNVLSRHIKVPDPQYDWKVIGRTMVKYGSTNIAIFRAFIQEKCPLALIKSKTKCCFSHCEAQRDGKSPACSVHMCPLCATLAGVPGRRVHKMPSFVHLVSKEYSEMWIRQEGRRCFDMGYNNDSFCWGVMSPCGTTKGFYSSSDGCLGEACIPSVLDGSTLPEPLQICFKCREANFCLTQYNRSKSEEPRHLFDWHDPERRSARVCNDPKCTRKNSCLKCGKSWFDSARSQEDLLCVDCNITTLCCRGCKRLSLHSKKDLFFAQSLVWKCGYSDGWKEYCIFCIVTKAPKAFRSERTRALVLQWRFSYKREHAYLSHQWATRPLDWVRATFGRKMSTSQQWLMDNHPPSGSLWEFFFNNRECWDSTWFLLYRLAGLPKDLFIKIFLLL